MIKKFLSHLQSILGLFIISWVAISCGFVTSVYAASEVELLSTAWHISAQSNAVELYEFIPTSILKGTESITVTYDLHGTCIMGGDASAIIFDQPINKDWRYISLAKYGSNCKNGSQSVTIPMSAFSGLDPSLPVGILHTRFWHNKPYTIDITSIKAIGSSGVIDTPVSMTPTGMKLTITPTKVILSPTPTISKTSTPTPTKIVISPTILPTPTAAAQQTWEIQSVSSMKESKDRICNQRTEEFIQKYIARAKELGANYVSIETPYDNPSCGDAVAYSKKWIKTTRAAGLKVWHRHMPLAFESIYDTPKTKSNFLPMIANYIKNNKSDFVEGDIFTPIPEPQNGGISGVTHCASGVCQFASQAEFNTWLRDAITTSESAFASIGLGGKMKIGYFGFDGFITWGDNNPDWDGILEDSTIDKMGNVITIDHYPELVGGTMATDLDELQKKYPGALIMIGEWGTVTGSNTEQQVRETMQAADRPNVIGFNYWHFGVGGNESLINEDLSKKVQFDEVQSMYKNK